MDGQAVPMPTVSDLAEAHRVFKEHESRDLFYRAATALVELARTKRVDLTVGEALAVLLQTWNRAFYQYHPAGPDHLDKIDEVVAANAPWLQAARERSITSLVDEDGPQIIQVFQSLELVLGAVGAAKALHLLAPRFLPLWDGQIAPRYQCGLTKAGTNGARYVRFMHIAQEQGRRVGGDEGVGRNVLKALDEFNYCVFTRKWMPMPDPA